MQKDFDSWNKNKKDLENASTLRYAYPREIWWCSLGLNIGAEIDGKNENFERLIKVGVLDDIVFDVLKKTWIRSL